VKLLMMFPILQEKLKRTAQHSVPDIQIQLCEKPVILESVCMYSPAMLNDPNQPQIFPIIFDTGAILAITPSKADLIDFQSTSNMTLGGMANGISIEGNWTVYWTFQQQDGKQLTLKTQAYYVPKATSRLLSPQRLFDKENGVAGSFTGNEKELIITINNIGSLHIPYSKANSLPIAYAFNNTDYPTCNINLSIYDKTNQNLTGGQKTLLHWHNSFGHLNLQAVQQILQYPPFTQQMFHVASKCDTYLLKCSICEYAKAHRRSISTKHTTNSCAGILKADHLCPGCQVCVDHF
jgi:hypothetical protein